MEVLVSAKLKGGEGNAGSLSDSVHHHALMVLHQKNLLEVGLLHL